MIKIHKCVYQCVLLLVCPSILKNSFDLNDRQFFSREFYLILKFTGNEVFFCWVTIINDTCDKKLSLYIALGLFFSFFPFNMAASY